MCKKIAIAAMKGGVGKTMLSVQIATTLAKNYGKKVLFVDTDAQSNSTNYFGIDEFEEGYKGFKDALEGTADLKDCIRHTNVEGVDILGSTIYITALDFKLFQMPAREVRLKTCFAKNEELLKEYDYVIFDTNPSMNLINQNVFVATDNIVLVTEASSASAKGLDLFRELWSSISESLDIDDKIRCVILNRVDNRTNIAKQFKDYIKVSIYKHITLNNYITESTAFKNAEAGRNPLANFLAKNKQSKQIEAVVDELFKREVL